MKIISFALCLAMACISLAPLAAQDMPVSSAAGPPPAIAAPAPGKGRIVFFRKGTLIGGAISCAVHEGGVKLTGLPPGRFAAIDVDPGQHDFTVASEASDTLRLDVQAGATYFALCTIGMGLAAGHPHLRGSDAATFSAMAAKLKPAKAAG